MMSAFPIAMTAIRPADLDDKLDADNPFVLDIRPRRSYQSYAINGSHNVPVYGDLQRGNTRTLRDALNEIPRDRDVVVVCKQGVVAKRATKLLNQEGFNAATLNGGIAGWKGYQNDSFGYRVRSRFW